MTTYSRHAISNSHTAEIVSESDASGYGLILLDPHGSVYRNVLKYVVESRLDDRPIIPLDFSRDDWILGYNPLSCPKGADPSVVVGALVLAMAHVFGQRDTQGTPRFGRVSTTVLLTLLQQGRPLLEAAQLVSSQAAMTALAASVREQFTKADLIRAGALSEKDFYNEVESTLNRLRKFSQNQRFKAMFGHVGDTLDLGKVLNDGAIVLVNLEQAENKLSEEDAAVFGSMLLTDLWTKAKNRRKPDDARDIKPFYVYIDEAQNFVTPDIAKNLTQARGYGLNVILASQYPDQFAEAGENGKAMKAATMAAARSIAVFQMEPLDDLEALTKKLFLGVLDPMKVKRWTTKVVGYETVDITSVTEGTNTQESESEGAHEGRAVSKSQRQRREDETDEPDIYKSEQDVDGTSTTRATVKGGNESKTVTPTSIPIMGQEVAEHFSLEDQLTMYQQLLHGQDNRNCMVRLASAKVPVAIRTLDVPPAWVDPEDVEAYLQEQFRTLPFALPFAEAIETAEKREADFIASVMKPAADSEPTSARRKVKVMVKPTTKKPDTEPTSARRKVKVMVKPTPKKPDTELEKS